MEKKYKVIDLFCGCGGLSKGFELAGFEITGGVDFLNGFFANAVFTDKIIASKKTGKTITHLTCQKNYKSCIF